MNFPGSVHEILRREGIEEPAFLGAGEDAYAFALSSQEAIRIFPAASPDFVAELAQLYETLQGHSFSFSYPQVYDVRTHGGIAYTIERRLPGREMGEVCREMDKHTRQRILQNYLNAIRELAMVEIDERDFGGLIPSSVWLQTKTWEEFLRRQLEAALQKVSAPLTKEFPDLHRLMARLEAQIDGPLRWERKSLVHGDAYPNNVLIGADGEVATLLDFGRHTLLGDPRLDIAIAIELTELAGFAAEDTVYLRSSIDEDPVAANACRAYTAILLAAEYRRDERILRKCLHSMREAFDAF